MEKIKTTLEQQREDASIHSLGISSDLIYKKVLQKIRELKLVHGNILDFGGGKGDFVRMLLSQKDLKFQVYAVDLMHTRIEGVHWYVQDLNKKLQVQDQHFDLITCIEVIEHLENPRHVVRDIYHSLKPGGHIILTTPNNESWRSLISYVVRGHFVSFTESSYPAHITSLNRMDIQRILQEAGFKDIQFSFTDFGMVPKVSQFSWQKLSLGVLKGLRYSDNIIAIAKK